MRRFIFFFILISTFWSCSDLETIEVKEGDIVTESYTRRKSDFAKHGTYQRFSPDGKVAEKSEYVENVLHGKQEFFYPNGQVQELVHYKNGKHDGIFNTFFENGKIEQEGMYVDGTLNGEFKGYYSNGQLKEVLIYKNNEELGPFTEYHKNGKLKTEGNYGGADPDTNIALEHGELKKYDEKGEHYQTMNCTHGLCLTTWKKEGVEINIE